MHWRVSSFTGRKTKADLKLELRAALAVIDQLKETVAAYEQNHTDELSHKVALLIRIAELERHLGSAVQGQLQTQISNMQAANQQLARSASAQQQADSSQAALGKLEAAEKQISSLYAQLAAASTEKARLQELLEAANEQVAAADELTASLQAQLSEIGEENVYLQGLLDAANQQIDALQSTNPEMTHATALGSTLASQESCTAGTGSSGGTGGTASSDGTACTAAVPAQPLIRSMTLLQQTQQEAINLHSRLTAAQHAKAALASELECARTERDLLMHDNASLTQRIAVIESELKTKLAAAQQAAAQAFDAQQQISACLGGLALLGLKSSGSSEECSGSNGGASGSNARSNGGSVSFGGSDSGTVRICGSSDGGSGTIVAAATAAVFASVAAVAAAMVAAAPMTRLAPVPQARLHRTPRQINQLAARPHKVPAKDGGREWVEQPKHTVLLRCKECVGFPVLMQYL